MATALPNETEEMLTRKIGPTVNKGIFAAMTNALKPVTAKLDVIAKNTHAMTPEAMMEQKKRDEKNQDEEEKQTGTLKRLSDFMKKRAEKSSVLKFLKDNWGKLVLGLGLLLIPIKELVTLWRGIKKAFEFMWDHPKFTAISGALLYLAGPKGIITAIAGLGLLLSKFSVARQTADMIGPRKELLPKTMGQKIMGGGMILAGIAMAIKDGFEGAKLSSEWGTSKASGVAGAVLGGTDKGLMGAIKNMGKWALIGAGIGSFVPVIGTLIGGVIGAVLGAILGWIGGENIAKGFDWVGKKFTAIWKAVKKGFTNLMKDIKVYAIDPVMDFVDDLIDGFVLLGEDFKIYLIDPILNAVDKMKEWVIDAATTILPDWLLKKFGMPTRPKATDKQKEELGQGGSTAVVKKDVTGIESEMTHIENEMAGIEQKGEANYWEKPEYKKLATKLNKLREEKEKIMGGDEPPTTTTEPPTAPTTEPPTAPTTEPTTSARMTGLNVTSEMEDKWADHRGIKQKGRMGKRARRRRANLDLKKQLMRGQQKEIKEALGDELYGKMTGTDAPTSIQKFPDHTEVKESQANMGGVSWNKFGGRDTVEGIILSTWNDVQQAENIKLPAPTFTSGYRAPDHPLSKTNPRSQHIHKTAFDLRSRDLPKPFDTKIFSALKTGFGGGVWGQYEKGKVNKDKRMGEHFHFQLAASGFSGTVDKATGFIAGEAGPERVEIIPLNDPSKKMAGMQKLTDEWKGAKAAPSIVTVNNTQNSSSGTSVMTMIPQIRGKQIPT